MPISRTDVVRAAIELLDDEGLAGLTLRGVAARLGVSAPTLYWHVKDKRHLLDLIADRVMAEVPESTRVPRDGESIRDWLAESMRARRALLLRHRDSAQVVAGNRPTEDGLPGIERTLRVLVDAGLEPGEAVRVLTALGSFLLGDALETQATRDRPLEEPPTGDLSRFPTLAAATRTVGDDEERFEEGLTLLLDGLHARLERRRGRRGSPGMSAAARMVDPARSGAATCRRWLLVPGVPGVPLRYPVSPAAGTRWVVSDAELRIRLRQGLGAAGRDSPGRRRRARSPRS